jgi:hypothetical protein
MNVNGKKMIPVETIPGMGGGGIKDLSGEFNCVTVDIL